jgi:hypothetical protein
VTDLCEIFANVIVRAGKIVAKWARLPSLASALSKELARDVRGICSRRKSVPKSLPDGQT